MKKLFFLMAMAMLVLAACTSNDDNPATPPEPEPTAEYTIMYYGYGGGNLDNIFLQMINEVYKASPDVFKKVNVVGQYKYSPTENMLEQNYWSKEDAEWYGCKTFRWVVDPDKDAYEQLSGTDNLYDAGNADCTCPDSLTNFINWAAKAYPAKKYMLIMNSHGGYRPNDELPETAPATTRGVVYDDGYDNKHFTAKSLHRAIAAANVRFGTIYMWACLMNNLEYQFELQDLCDYVIASTYSMPATGGVFNVLVEQLSKPSVDIEQALTTFCKADVESWDKVYADAGVPEDFPVYTDDGERYDFNLFPTDDLQYYRIEVNGNPVPWGSTLADTYEQLAFDRAVGWSRWLRLNRQWPNLFCPKDLYFELPVPEEE